MEVDPRHVYAYWEVTPEDRVAAASRLGGDSAPVRWILRFHEAARGEPKQFDVDVDLAPGNWYVSLPAAGRSYRAELGPVDARGRFAAASRSNTVHVPRSEASPRYGPRWMRVGGTHADSAAEPQQETAPATGHSGTSDEGSRPPGPRRRRAPSGVRPSVGSPWDPGRDPVFEEPSEHAWPDSEASVPPAEIPGFEDISSFELGFRREEDMRPEAPGEAESQRRK